LQKNAYFAGYPFVANDKLLVEKYGFFVHILMIGNCVGWQFLRLENHNALVQFP